MPILNKLNPMIVAGLLLAGFSLTGCNRQGDATAPPQAPPPEVAVITLEPRSIILTTELSGRTAPCLIAEVRPQVGGIIQQRRFEEGAVVTAGQLLYQIDPASYQAAFDSAQAALARAEAQLTPARFRAERFRKLSRINAISLQDLDDAEAAFKLAEAEVAAARAALRTARINLDYTAVKAPITGRIGRSAVTTGALVTAGQAAPLAIIQQLDPIYVDVTQSSAELLRLKRELASGALTGVAAGQARVRLRLEDGTSYELPGSFKFSDVTVNQSTGSVTLRTVFPNPAEVLLPGMYVQARLEEGTLDRALLVPQRGVSRNPAGEALVMVVGTEEKVEPRVIQVARTVGDDWLVAGGLEPGDRVILEGLQRIRPGMLVKAVPFEAKPEATQPTATTADKQ